MPCMSLCSLCIQASFTVKYLLFWLCTDNKLNVKKSTHKCHIFKMQIIVYTFKVQFKIPVATLLDTIYIIISYNLAALDLKWMCESFHMITILMLQEIIPWFKCRYYIVYLPTQSCWVVSILNGQVKHVQLSL